MKKLKTFGFEDCVKEGLLRKIPASKEKARNSIKTARNWLKEAENNLKANAFNSSVLSSYLAMFHSARAILFIDGFREKSHYCVARYLEEKYAKKNLLERKWIELLDHYRELRHSNQYGLTFFVIKIEAEKGFHAAKEFVERMNELLESKEPEN